jgi:predicted secreted protein
MDFRDCRSMTVVLVPHCVLNQNSRLAGCAERPSAVHELVEGLMQRQIGIVQMPCPELMVLGLDRQHIQIRSGLESHPVRQAFRQWARELVYQIQQYRQCGVKVLGVLGKNGSPACGVEETWRLERGPGMGVFIEELKAALQEAGVELPLAGTMDAEPQAALGIVDKWQAGG